MLLTLLALAPGTSWGTPAEGGAPAATPLAPGRPPRTEALFLNGGGSAKGNFLSHFHHLQDLAAALRARGIPADRIHVFSADGENPAPDLSERAVPPEGFWLIEGTPAAATLNPPHLANSTWEGVTLHPARVGELRRWFAGMRRTLQPGDTLLVFVTDHGSRNPDDSENGLITMWDETLSVLEFRALVAHLRPGVRVASIMSQCFSGSFSAAMTPFNAAVPSGDFCGFFSTTADRPAYGCYPEGRDRDRVGHAFRFIDALDRHSSLDDAHTAVLLTDDSPDVPVRTSDLYLDRLIADEAARRGAGADAVTDALLARAWKDRARWEPQIRLLDRLGQVYGTFSPRSLAELAPRIQSLDALAEELETYSRRWKLALDDLRRENLTRFRAHSTEWNDRLEPAKLEGADRDAKAALLAALLPALKEFSVGQPHTWARLTDLRGREQDAGNARYRSDIRLAALLRMKALLLRIAGTELVGGGLPADWIPPKTAPAAPTPPTAVSPSDAPAPAEDEPAPDAPEATSTPEPPAAASKSSPAAPALPPEPAPDPSQLRGAIEALERCESSVIGSPAIPREQSPLLEAPEPLPPVEEDMAAVKRALPSWLGIQFRPLPDSRRKQLSLEPGAVVVGQVYLDTPARAAGFQPGDVVLGPPEAHFTETNQLREWTMTSPRGTPLTLEVLRDGNPLQFAVTLTAYPTKLPDLPAPPKTGETAPALSSLRVLRPATEGYDPGRGAHMLFFWATWCQPCKKSLPELMAWGRETKVPILAVTDEEESVVRSFLASWTTPFPQAVATDETRRIQADYGISGTPTFVLVNAEGRIEWRHVGYSPKDHLGVPGWKWTP